MKRALWILLLLPGLCALVFGGDRPTCEDTWHCVAPDSALAATDQPADETDAVTAFATKAAPDVAPHVASILLDVPPGDR